MTQPPAQGKAEPTESATNGVEGARAVLSSLYADRRDVTRRRRRTIGFVVGLVLLAAAVYVVAHNLDSMKAAIAKVAGGSWWILPTFLALPFFHLPLTGAIFWAATPPDAAGNPRVCLREMTALISVGNLANYLPLRPGMVARLAYHRAVNNIPVVESAKILGTVVAAGLVAASLFLAASFAAAWSAGGSIPLLPVAVLALPVAIGLLGSIYLRAGSSTHAAPMARWWLVLTLRYIDLGVWAGRYALAFWAIGVPLSAGQAAIYAVAANGAMLIPIAGNGLGIREWVIGLAGPLLPAAILGASSVKEQGMSADLLNRVAEIAMSIVAGSLAAAWITRHVKRRTTGANPATAPSVLSNEHRAAGGNAP